MIKALVVTALTSVAIFLSELPAPAYAQCNQSTVENCSSNVYELSSIGMQKLNKWLEESKKNPIKWMVFDFEENAAIKVTAFRRDDSVRTFYISLDTFEFLIKQTGITPNDLIKLARGV